MGIFLALLLMGAVLTGALDATGAALEPVRPTKPMSLFNGRNLDGFSHWLVDTRDQDPRHVFTVTNGCIRISGDGLGYLSTMNAYRDYQLTLEYRWGKTNHAWGNRIGHARDSGLFLHATGPDGNSEDGKGAFMAAIECNIFEGATGDFLLIRGRGLDGSLIAPRITFERAVGTDREGWFTWHAGGTKHSLERWGRLNWFGKDPNWRDTIGFRGRKDVERLGWNKLEAVCDGAGIVIRLNGVVVNRVTNVWPSSGRILLQCEGSEVFFRKIRLSPIR